MEFLASDHLINLKPPYVFAPPCEEDYALLLVIADKQIDQDTRSKLCEDIIGSNCRYFMARGHLCGEWDDAVDLAQIIKEIDTGKKQPLIMTTWHENEPIEDTLFFLYFHAFDSEKDRLIIHKYVMFLGADDQLIESYKKIIDAKAYLVS